MRWLHLLIVGVVIAVAGQALAATQPEAEAAYARGDYATAFKMWLPLAEQGSAYAATNIARMYERGEWVAEDKAMADEWYRRAAAFQARDDSTAPSGQVAHAPNPVLPVMVPPMTQPIVQPITTQPIVTRPVVYTVPVYYPARPIYVAPPPPRGMYRHHSRRH